MSDAPGPAIRFAYADPPYPGKAKKHYGDHPDYAGEVDHAELIARLEDEFPDGWALSTSATALAQLLPLCPPPISRGAVGGGVRHQFRILSWCKPYAVPGTTGPLYGWEPVILRGGRREKALNPYPRDWLVASPELYTLRKKPAGHVVGAKPPDFCRWLFACAGLLPGDELVDVFPGSGAVAAEWALWSRAPQLAQAGGEQLAIDG
jgi:hypothetical protein